MQLVIQGKLLALSGSVAQYQLKGAIIVVHNDGSMFGLVDQPKTAAVLIEVNCVIL